MSDDERELNVVGLRVTWRQVMLPPGSVVMLCNCGHRAWFGTVSQRYLATPKGAGAYTWCSVCVSPFDESLERRALPGSFEENAEAFGPKFAEAIRKVMIKEGVQPDD